MLFVFGYTMPAQITGSNNSAAIGRSGTRATRSSYNWNNSTLATDFQVLPVVETSSANGTYFDAADDMCIWIHPVDVDLSLVIGQSKDDRHGGLHVYDLAGRQLQFLEHGKINNTDLRYNFPLGEEQVDIVAASNRSNDSIFIYKIDAAERLLENIGQIRTGHPNIYGLCMYHNPSTNKFYVIVNFLDGFVQQWLISDGNDRRIIGTKVREFDVGGQTEGCVADDEYGRLYIGEENAGIWQYGAEPNDGTTRRVVDTPASGHFRAGIEGLTIYYAADGAGYIIVSDQTSSRFVIYNRQGQNDYITSFKIVENQELGIDGCSQTDGIDVTNVSLGANFPSGLFVAHDGNNTGKDNKNSNFKYVPWDSIAKAAKPALIIDTSWNPRNVKSIPSETGGFGN